MKLANYCYTQINLTKVTVDKESQIEKDVYCMILFRESLKEAKLIYGIKFQYGDPLWGRRTSPLFLSGVLLQILK